MNANDTVLVDPEHINVLIWTGLWLRIAQHDIPVQWPVLDEFGRVAALNTLTPQTADRVGQMLLDTNARAVNTESGHDNLYVYSYAEPRHREWQIVEILRALDFYVYQAAQNDDWLFCEAYFFCYALNGRLIQQLPGYLSARPHITAQTWPAMAKEWHTEKR